MSDWTPPLNEHLLTFNGLWTYTQLCHTNAPPLKRHPNLEHRRLFFTILSKFPCVLCPKIEWPSIPKIVHLWHSATACGEMEKSELQTLEIRCVCVCVCARECLLALIEQWPEKGNTLGRPWDKRPTHCKTCPMSWLWELWRNQILWNFMKSFKRSNKRWLLKCPS